jgi:hypothetical protein
MKDNLKTNESAAENKLAKDSPRLQEQAPGVPCDGTKIYVPGQSKSGYTGHIIR